MGNHKEIIKSYITRSLLFLSSLGLPACIHAADMPESSVGLRGCRLRRQFRSGRLQFEDRCPDGGSLTPQIGMSYNSQSGGYGLAGYGFNITGLSAITRGGHDLFHDGRQESPIRQATISTSLFLRQIAACIDPQEDEQQDGESPQRRAAITEERQRDADYRRETKHHAYVDEHME